MMRYNKIVLAVFVGMLCAAGSLAQGRPFNEAGNQANDNPRAGLMRELGLTVDQIQQIRKIRLEAGPLKQKAEFQLQKARRDLDQSIYGENVNEGEIESKIAAVAEAQAAVTKINALHELKVRQVLTAEQLLKFREIRSSFAERRKMRQNQRPRDLNRRQPRGIRNDRDQRRPPER